MILFYIRNQFIGIAPLFFILLNYFSFCSNVLFVRTIIFIWRILCFLQAFVMYVHDVLFHNILTVLFFVYVSILIYYFIHHSILPFYWKIIIFLVRNNYYKSPYQLKYIHFHFLLHTFVFFYVVFFYSYIITLFFTLHHYHRHFILLHYTRSCFIVQIANVNLHHQEVSWYIVTHVIMITTIHLCHHHQLHHKVIQQTSFY